MLQDCPAKNQLWEFVSGDLAEPEATALESHLALCQTCGDTVRAFHASDTWMDWLRTVGSVELPAPDPALSGIMQALHELPVGEDADPHASRVADHHLEEVVRCLQPSEDAAEVGRLAHYRVLRRVGSGGMGVVFQAEDTKLARTVALKILRPSLGVAAQERFLQEARAAAAIEHDNVVTIFDVGQEGPLAYLAMPWIPGETLEERLRREVRLPASEVGRLAAQIASGLAAAHEKHLVHRDIKPANIWLETARDRVTILDFGLARVADEDQQLTETGMIAGTPAYMSPEQAQGQRVDARTDLFSLGTLMYRSLTGELPFQGANPLATLRSVQHDTPPPPHARQADIPHVLSDTVTQLLAKNRSDRPNDAGHVALALEHQSRLSAVTSPSLPVRQRGLTLTLVATALLGVLGWFAGAPVYRIVTRQGILEVSPLEPGVTVQVLQDGKEVVTLDAGRKRITLAAGGYQLQLQGDAKHLTLNPPALELRTNEREFVQIQRSSPKASMGTASEAGPVAKPAEYRWSLTPKEATKWINRGNFGRGVTVEVTEDRGMIARGPQDALDQLDRRLRAEGVRRSDAKPKVVTPQDAFRHWYASGFANKGTQDANEPLYKSQTLAVWLQEARVERDPARLREVVRALGLLGQGSHSQACARAVLAVMRIHGYDRFWWRANRSTEDDRTQLNEQARAALLRMSPDGVIDALLAEAAARDMEHYRSQLFALGLLEHPFANLGMQLATYQDYQRLREAYDARHDEVIRQLLACIRDEKASATQRSWAIEFLAWFCESLTAMEDSAFDYQNFPEVVTVLTETLATKDEYLKHAVCQALVTARPETPKLAETIFGGANPLAQHAPWLLQQLGEHAAPVVPKLISRVETIVAEDSGDQASSPFNFRHWEYDASRLAIQTLPKIGVAAKSALPLLHKLAAPPTEDTAETDLRRQLRGPAQQAIEQLESLPEESPPPNQLR